MILFQTLHRDSQGKGEGFLQYSLTWWQQAHFTSLRGDMSGSLTLGHASVSCQHKLKPSTRFPYNSADSPNRPLQTHQPTSANFPSTAPYQTTSSLQGCPPKGWVCNNGEPRYPRCPFLQLRALWGFTWVLLFSKCFLQGVLGQLRRPLRPSPGFSGLGRKTKALPVASGFIFCLLRKEFQPARAGLSPLRWHCVLSAEW